MDFSSLSLHQTKRKEMDAQVKVLELEKALEQAKQQLYTLRKQHYQMAGEEAGWDKDVIMWCLLIFNLIERGKKLFVYLTITIICRQSPIW
jgi:hypothetical protein